MLSACWSETRDLHWELAQKQGVIPGPQHLLWTQTLKQLQNTVRGQRCGYGWEVVRQAVSEEASVKLSLLQERVLENQFSRGPTLPFPTLKEQEMSQSVWGGRGVAEQGQGREQQAKATCLTGHQVSMALMPTHALQEQNKPTVV